MLADWHPDRHGTTLRLPHVVLPETCEHPGCADPTVLGCVFDPDRLQLPEPVPIVMCHRHGTVLLETALTYRDPRLPGPFTWMQSPKLHRSTNMWHRPVTTAEAVAAIGAARCERCPAQAVYLTYGVDHGAGDKWWPALLCAEHALEHAGFNDGTLEQPGDNFSVDLTWTGTDWGRPLSWPLTQPAPEDVIR